MPIYSPANTFVITSTPSFALNGASDEGSMRFTAQASKSCDSVRINMTNLTGTSPTYTIGIQGNSGGDPDDVFLISKDMQLADGWNTVSFTGSQALVKDTVYHIVITYKAGTIDGSNFISHHYGSPGNTLTPYDQVADTQQAVFYNTGGGWTERADRTPMYIVGYTDSTFEGQPYDFEASSDIDADFVLGQLVKMREFAEIDAVGFLLSKQTADTPSVDLSYEIRNASDNVLRKGTMLAKDTVTTTPTWYDAALDSNLILNERSVYKFILLVKTANTSASDWKAQVYQTETSVTDRAYEDTTYGGRDSMGLVIYPQRNPRREIMDKQTDINFRLRRVPRVVES